MTADAKPHRAHLYLIEVLIAVLLLGGAGYLLVRNARAAKERAQRQQITTALNELQGAHWESEQQTKAAQRIFALGKANPKIHDAKSSGGWTPLHAAAWADNRDIAQWLLDHGADINAKNNDGLTPLHWAAFHGSREVAALLLAQGEHVNVKTNVGATPLHWAAQYGRKEVAELLLAKGADVSAKDDGGGTPMHWARTNSKEEIIDLLRKHGAKE